MKLHHVPRIYFLHIPKTAGTSFRLWLERLYAPDDVLLMDHLDELQGADDALLKEKWLFSGHFGWRMMERAKELGLKVEPVTMLREPTALYRSGWRFADLIPEEDAAKLGSAREAVRDIVEKIRRGERPSRNPDSANMCTRYLAHWGTEVATPVRIDEVMLALAKMRLHSMKFFGLVEDWERTAILFAYAFTLPLREMDLVANITGGATQAELPAEVEELLADDNRFDFQLYEFGRELFDQRFAAAAAALGLSVTAPLAEFRQPLLERFLRSMGSDRALTPVTKSRVSVSEGIIAKGFQHRYQTQGGDWQLWSGPERVSTLYLPLDRSRDLEVTLDFKVFMSSLIQNNLRILVDGRVVEFEREYKLDADEQYYTVIRLCVPKRDGLQRVGVYTTLQFEVPELVKVDIAEFPNPISFALSGEIAIRPAATIVIDAHDTHEPSKGALGRN